MFRATTDLTENPLFTIAQKSVIGHGLGASGAYAINGGL